MAVLRPPSDRSLTMRKAKRGSRRRPAATCGDTMGVNTFQLSSVTSGAEIPPDQWARLAARPALYNSRAWYELTETPPPGEGDFDSRYLLADSGPGRLAGILPTYQIRAMTRHGTTRRSSSPTCCLRRCVLRPRGCPACAAAASVTTAPTCWSTRPCRPRSGAGCWPRCSTSPCPQ